MSSFGRQLLLFLVLVLLLSLLVVVIRKILRRRERERMYLKSRNLTEGLELPTSPSPSSDPLNDSVDFQDEEGGQMFGGNTDPVRYDMSAISPVRDEKFVIGDDVGRGNGRSPRNVEYTRGSGSEPGVQPENSSGGGARNLNSTLSVPQRNKNAGQLLSSNDSLASSGSCQTTTSGGLDTVASV